MTDGERGTELGIVLDLKDKGFRYIGDFPINRYIDIICVHEDYKGRGKWSAGYPATCVSCGLTF